MKYSLIKQNKLEARAALGGLLAGISLNQLGIFLMPLALLILWSCYKSIKGSFIWGAVSVLISHYWILYLHPLDWAGIPSALSLPITISIWIICGSLGGILVSIWSLLGRGISFYFNNSNSLLAKNSKAIFLSAIWGISETILSHLPFFWIGIGSSLITSDIILNGLAKWIGAGGIATIQLLISWWIWRIWLAFEERKRWRTNLYIGLVFVASLHLIGLLLLKSNSIDTSSKVAVWQTSIPIRKKFEYDQQKLIPHKLKYAINKANDLGAEFLVAPEGTLMANQNLLSPSPIPLLSGGFRWVNNSQRSSLLFFNAGDVKFSNAIDKYRLVPLGERIPNIRGISLNALSAIGGIQPGNSSRLFNWAGKPAAVAICYEISDGNNISRAINDGAEWIVAIANLDPYPIALQNQFLSLSQSRSIENGKDLLIASNTGPSALIMPTGEKKLIVKPFNEEIGVSTLNYYSKSTLYSKLQEKPLMAISLFSLIILIYENRITNHDQ